MTSDFYPTHYHYRLYKAIAVICITSLIIICFLSMSYEVYDGTPEWYIFVPLLSMFYIVLLLTAISYYRTVFCDVYLPSNIDEEV